MKAGCKIKHLSIERGSWWIVGVCPRFCATLSRALFVCTQRRLLYHAIVCHIKLLTSVPRCVKTQAVSRLCLKPGDQCIFHNCDRVRPWNSSLSKLKCNFTFHDSLRARPSRVHCHCDCTHDHMRRCFASVFAWSKFSQFTTIPGTTLLITVHTTLKRKWNKYQYLWTWSRRHYLKRRRTLVKCMI